MSRRSGRAMKVTVGTYTVAGISQYTMDGISRETVEDTEFGDDITKFQYGFMDGGGITISGGYDPDDATGQTLLDSACVNASMLGSGQLRLYIDNTSYFTIDTTGRLLITKCRSVDAAHNGLGKISITAKVSGGKMMLI